MRQNKERFVRGLIALVGESQMCTIIQYTSARTASSRLDVKASCYAFDGVGFVFLTFLSAAVQHHAQLAARLCRTGAQAEALCRPWACL